MSYGQKKLKQAVTSISYQLSQAYEIPPSDLTKCTDCDDLAHLMADLKFKCAAAPTQEKMKLLTLIPESWSVSRAHSEFKDVPGVAEYLITQARALKSNHGLLADPLAKRGRPLSSETKQAVLDFFEDDEYSRMCPGQNDKVSVRNVEGVKE